MRTYRATGRGITAVVRLFGITLRVTGLARLPDRPVLFVANHFTRFETFLLPYLIFRRFGVPVRSLATHTIFHGWFARYLGACGVMSTRAPERNRTIVGELMTKRAHWVIYPEGGLVKNKRTVDRGRLKLDRAERQAPPHTGAALMALKAEIRKRRYGAACEAGDDARRRGYEERYGLTGPGDVAARSGIVVPVTITFPRLRAGSNGLHALARLLTRNRIGVRLDEELRVEGSLLARDAEISVHFGDPIDVADHLGRTRELARRVAGWLGSPREEELFLRGRARKLTDEAMRAVYAKTEINFEHLFCYGLRALRRDLVPIATFHRALYVAAAELRRRDGLRLHPDLQHGITALIGHASAEGPYRPLARVVDLLRREGVLSIEDDRYVIDRTVLERDHAFHAVRLSAMTQVIANELEPVPDAPRIVREVVNLSDQELAARLPVAVCEGDLAFYRREYDRWHETGVSRPSAPGEPFFLRARNPRAGIVLVHGYLAAPVQMRPLAEHLHAAGFSVYVVRLDGHGTTPRHLHEIPWRRWLETLRRAERAVHHACPHTIVGGFSLGGILAARLAAEMGTSLDGLFLVNTPMRLRSRLAPLVPAALQLDRALLRRWRGGRPATLVNPYKTPDNTYGEHHLASVRELRRAMRASRRRLGDVRAPALVIQSDDDPVVVPRSADLLAARLGGRTEIIRLPGDRHVVVRGPGCQTVHEAVLEFIDRLTPGATPPAAPDRTGRRAGPRANGIPRRRSRPEPRP